MDSTTSKLFLGASSGTKSLNITNYDASYTNTRTVTANNGDLVIGVATQSGSPPAIPASWILLTSVSGNNACMRVFYRVKDSSWSSFNTSSNYTGYVTIAGAYSSITNPPFAFNGSGSFVIANSGLSTPAGSIVLGFTSCNNDASTCTVSGTLGSNVLYNSIVSEPAQLKELNIFGVEAWETSLSSDITCQYNASIQSGGVVVINP